MPRQSYTSVIAHTTDADFRAWAKQLSDALKACLTQTSDTGQVNWATNDQVKPVSGTPFYEIYRFSDALQATAPIFLKVEYGTASSNPSWRITIGTGTNGAGTLVGLVQGTSASGSSLSTLTQTTYVCYKDGAFTLAWGMRITSTSPNYLVVVDRARDSGGASTADGCLFVTSNTANSISAVQCSFVLGTFGGSSVPCLTNGTFLSAQSSASSVVNLFNWFCFTPDIHNIMAVFTYKNAEIAQYAEIDVAILGGASHHYLCVGNKAGSAFSAPGNASADVPAILWEE